MAQLWRANNYHQQALVKAQHSCLYAGGSAGSSSPNVEAMQSNAGGACESGMVLPANDEVTRAQQPRARKQRAMDSKAALLLTAQSQQLPSHCLTDEHLLTACLQQSMAGCRIQAPRSHQNSQARRLSTHQTGCGASSLPGGSCQLQCCCSQTHCTDGSFHRSAQASKRPG